MAEKEFCNRDKKGRFIKGHKHTSEVKKKLKKAWKYEKHITPQFREKQRAYRRGKTAPNKGMKGKWHLKEEIKKQMAKAKIGNKFGKSNKGKKRSEKSRRKMQETHIKYMASGKAKFRDTGIELKVEKELKRQGIPYMKQVPLEGIAIVDFLLPNKIIVQADGTYWHSKGKNKGKDIAQDTILGFKGYRIYRFTETQINKSVKRCINKIFGVRKV